MVPSSDAVDSDPPAASVVSGPSTVSGGVVVLSPIQPTGVIDVEVAKSINVATHEEYAPVVAWTSAGGVHVARWPGDKTESWQPVPVHGDAVPFAHPIERPAVGIADDGSVHVAFTSKEGDAGAVQYAIWNGTDLIGPDVISGEPTPETNLVYLTLDGTPTPILAWL